MRIKLLLLATTAGLLIHVAAAFAHHAFAAEYDDKKPITITGTVTKVEWMNPHVFFYIDVKDANGKLTNWRGEGGNLSTLMRRGWRKDSLKVGETITIEGSASKTGQPFLNARTVTRPDGQKLFAGPAGGVENP